MGQSFETVTYHKHTTNEQVQIDKYTSIGIQITNEKVEHCPIGPIPLLIHVGGTREGSTQIPAFYHV